MSDRPLLPTSCSHSQIEVRNTLPYPAYRTLPCPTLSILSLSNSHLLTPLTSLFTSLSHLTLLPPPHHSTAPPHSTALHTPLTPLSPPVGSLAALEQKARQIPQRNIKPVGSSSSSSSSSSSHPVSLDRQILSPRGSITPLVVLPRASHQSKQQSPFGLRRPLNDGTVKVCTLYAIHHAVFV